ncbi:MAG: DUF1844 domain-containing protein [bacterium]
MKADNPDKQANADGSALFSTLVWRLAVETRAFLGEQLHPEVESIEPQLPLAARSIDTLEMLKARTEGRRTEAESEMLDEVLYQLRIDYIAARRALEGKPRPACAPEPEPPADQDPPAGTASN